MSRWPRGEVGGCNPSNTGSNPVRDLRMVNRRGRRVRLESATHSNPVWSSSDPPSARCRPEGDKELSSRVAALTQEGQPKRSWGPVANRIAPYGVGFECSAFRCFQSARSTKGVSTSEASTISPTRSTNRAIEYVTTNAARAINTMAPTTSLTLPPLRELQAATRGCGEARLGAEQHRPAPCGARR